MRSPFSDILEILAHYHSNIQHYHTGFAVISSTRSRASGAATSVTARLSRTIEKKMAMAQAMKAWLMPVVIALT